MIFFSPLSVLFVVVGLLVVAWAVYDDLKRRAEAKKQHQSLFHHKKTDYTLNAPVDVHLLALTERQLASWQNLLKELETTKASLEQIRYCRQQIERFEQEIAWLKKR